MQQEKMKQKINFKISSLKQEKQTEMNFLRDLVIELEEQYRIELRKKAILKN